MPYAPVAPSTATALALANHGRWQFYVDDLPVLRCRHCAVQIPAAGLNLRNLGSRCAMAAEREGKSKARPERC